jgi:L-ornithine Nalpha-acyltransferase
MIELARKSYTARVVAGDGDVEPAFALRRRSFLPGKPFVETDWFDRTCQHVLVEEAVTGKLVCCYRLMVLEDGRQLGRTYSAQFYDLARLASYRGRMLELGRFCTDPMVRDIDVLRTAWGALVQVARARSVAMLFGCSSFPGTDPARHAASFSQLGARHLLPAERRPIVKSAEAIRFENLPIQACDAAVFPPLLRFYLSLGGRTSDHAVPDHKLNTLHVFTALETAQIPHERLKSLLALA